MLRLKRKGATKPSSWSNGKRRPLTPYQVALRAWHAECGALTAGQWVERLMARIEDERIRHHLASLVWWDWLGGSDDAPAPEQDARLDLMRDCYRHTGAASKDELLAGLMVLGYPEMVAEARAGMGEQRTETKYERTAV